MLTQDYGDRIRLAPPMCIAEVDLWRAIDEIERALGDLEGVERELFGRPVSSSRLGVRHDETEHLSRKDV